MDYSVMIRTRDNNVFANIQAAAAQGINMMSLCKWFFILNPEIHAANLTSVVIDRFQ